MFKSLFAVVALVFAVNAKAATFADVVVQTQLPSIMDQAHTMGLGWKVGDLASYDIDMGFIKGTMDMSVRSVEADGIWLVQDADLGFAGKQKIETLLDPNTGAIKKMIVNGKEQ